MFDPGTKLVQNRTSSSNRIGQASGSYVDSYGSRARNTAKNYAKYNSWNGTEVRFAPEMKAIDDSGICSPPLWTTSPPRSPEHRAAANTTAASLRRREPKPLSEARRS
ncbi:hypothetical protein SLA2020_429070 [Shorea laevis]